MSVTVIIGPSGSGKSSVAEVLQRAYGFSLEKTVTTRTQRNAYDVDHVFVTPEKFQTLLASDAFIGTLSFAGHDYGLPRFIASNHTLLLLRAPVIPELLASFPDAFIVHIDAPLNVLKQRLVTRGTADRVDETLLQQETILGEKLAHSSFDSSKETSEAIAAKISERIHLNVGRF